MTHDEQLIDMTAQKRSGVLPHDFGPITADYRVRCKRCGFEQYSAAPQPLMGCLSDVELDYRGPFIQFEIGFLLKRLAESGPRFEKLWQAVENGTARHYDTKL